MSFERWLVDLDSIELTTPIERPVPPRALERIRGHKSEHINRSASVRSSLNQSKNERIDVRPLFGNVHLEETIRAIRRTGGAAARCTSNSHTGGRSAHLSMPFGCAKGPRWVFADAGFVLAMLQLLHYPRRDPEGQAPRR